MDIFLGEIAWSWNVTLHIFSPKSSFEYKNSIFLYIFVNFKHYSKPAARNHFWPSEPLSNGYYYNLSSEPMS